MKRNPRPRKYESAAARQAAYKARAEMLEFRAEPKTAETLTSIAQELDISRSELLLSMVKFALTNHDWARFGLTHKTLPYYQGNPIMATKKATPAQLAARKKFAEMARSGAFKKAKVTKRKKNPTIQFIVYSELSPGKYKQMLVTENKQRAISLANQNEMGGNHSVVEDQVGHLIYDAKTRQNYLQSNPSKRKKTVSQKISQLVHEGYPQKQAVAVALSEKRAGKVKNNPEGAIFKVGKYYETRSIGDQNIKIGATVLSRTDKTVKVKGTDKLMKSSYRLTKDHNGNEIFYPWGRYSMAPMIGADDMKPQSNPIAEMHEFTVIRFDRSKNTTSGNPVYSFVLKDENGQLHYGKTKPNAGWVYAISSVYEGDKIRAALEETKGGRVYMTAYENRKSNPSKRSSSRSAVVPNPRTKKPQKFYKVSIMQEGLHKNWMGLANFYTFAEAENYAHYLSKQHKNWSIRVHDTRAMK